MLGACATAACGSATVLIAPVAVEDHAAAVFVAVQAFCRRLEPAPDLCLSGVLCVWVIQRTKTALVELVGVVAVPAFCQ